MRILVVSEGLDGLGAAEAGSAVASAWAGAGHQVAVVPMAVAGLRFVPTVASLLGAPLPLGAGVAVGEWDGRRVAVAGVAAPVAVPAGIDVHASSRAVGEALVAALGTDPDLVLLDLTGTATHDGGAGLLAALGADADRPLTGGVAGLTGVSRVLLPEAALPEVVAVVPAEELSASLLGLRGITARRGGADRLSQDTGRIAALLSTDETLGRWAGALGVADPQPPAGACGGTAFAASVLGARVTTGPLAIAGLTGAEATLAAADLVVVVVDSLGFNDRGGDVIATVAGWAAQVARPCIAVARSVWISNRELRTTGLENSYATGDVADAGALAARTASVAATWSW